MLSTFTLFVCLNALHNDELTTHDGLLTPRTTPITDELPYEPTQETNSIIPQETSSLMPQETNTLLPAQNSTNLDPARFINEPSLSISTSQQARGTEAPSIPNESLCVSHCGKDSKICRKGCRWGDSDCKAKCLAISRRCKISCHDDYDIEDTQERIKRLNSSAYQIGDILFPFIALILSFN